jgi:hypothetical protein
MKMKEKAMPKQLIRVVYPMDGGKIIASDGRELECAGHHFCFLQRNLKNELFSEKRPTFRNSWHCAAATDT